MTVAQLKDFGLTDNSWETFDGICTSILFNNDAHLFISQTTTMFYLDSAN